MPQKQKASAEEKVRVIRECLTGRLGQSEAARLLRVSNDSIRRWIKHYKAEGTSYFLPHEHNRVYKAKLKVPT